MAGVKSRLMSATRGSAVMTTTFAGYKPWAGDFDKRDRGNLLSHESGTVTGHGLKNAQERGSLFSAPGDYVYENQARLQPGGGGVGGAGKVGVGRGRFGPSQIWGEGLNGLGPGQNCGGGEGGVLGRRHIGSGMGGSGLRPAG